MLTRDEKLNQRKDFVNSDKFGMPTLVILSLFRDNVLGVLNTIGFYGELVGIIDDKSKINHNQTSEQILKTKQYIVLDCIARTNAIIESLLILIHSLSEGYSAVRINMIRYGESFWKIRDNIISKKYNIEKIFALCDIDSFSLSNEEKILLRKIYDETINSIYCKLESLIDFYEQYNVVYNKSKHGLTFSTGGFGMESEKNFENSAATFYDRREESKMPRKYMSAIPKNPDFEGWFNVNTVVNFNKKMLLEMGLVHNQIHIITNYVIDNHLTFASNCGQNYLPYVKKEENKYSVNFILEKSPTKEDSELMTLIQNKILPQMVLREVKLNMNHKYVREDLQNAVANNPVTNIWFTAK